METPLGSMFSCLDALPPAEALDVTIHSTSRGSRPYSSLKVPRIQVRELDE